MEVTPIVSSFQPKMSYSSKAFAHTDEISIEQPDFDKYFSPDKDRRGNTPI